MKLFFIYALLLAIVAINAQDAAKPCTKEVLDTLKDSEKCVKGSKCEKDSACEKFSEAYNKVVDKTCTIGEGDEKKTLEATYKATVDIAKDECKDDAQDAAKPCTKEVLDTLKDSEKCVKGSKCEKDSACKKFHDAYDQVKEKTCTIGEGDEKKTLEATYKATVDIAKDECKEDPAPEPKPCKEDLLKAVKEAAKGKCEEKSECKADGACRKLNAAYLALDENCLADGEKTLKDVYGEKAAVAATECKDSNCDADKLKAIVDSKPADCKEDSKCEKDSACKKFSDAYEAVKEKKCLDNKGVPLEEAYKTTKTAADKECSGANSMFSASSAIQVVAAAVFAIAALN